MSHYPLQKVESKLAAMNNLKAKYLLTASLTLSLLSPTLLANEPSLTGFWKSNKEMTLESMNSVEGIPPKVKEALEGDVFGRLYAEYTATEYRVWFEGEEDDLDTIEFAKFKVLVRSEEYWIISEESAEGEFIENKIFWKDGCYALMVPRWAFREYFCRTDPVIPVKKEDNNSNIPNLP
jgi:hypothetical protein